MKAGLIGFLIIVFSYAIATFVINLLLNIAGNNGSEYGNGYDNVIGGTFGDGALGGGVIEYHYPERDQQNVARNTMIMVTFKVPVATSTVVGGNFGGGSVGASLCDNYTANNSNGNKCGKLNSNIVISNSSGSQEVSKDDVVIVLQADGKSILIDPIVLLGSDKTNQNIKVHLKQGIQSSDSKPIFGNMLDGYSWNFETSTYSDTTPPKVVSVWPKEDTTVARNAIIQINFSEPINILSMNGNITASSSGVSIPGQPLKISNKYKSVEFISATNCEGVAVNSCGEPVFCLPRNSLIDVLVKAGNLTDLLSGINDAAGNFLDGNKNGESSGSPTDDYKWSFSTNDTINVQAPVINSTSPSSGASIIPINTDVSATFNKVLSPSSVNSDNFYIYKFDNSSGSSCSYAGEDKTQISTSCFPNYSTSVDTIDSGTAQYSITKLKVHSPYLDKNFTYRPRITSRVKDSYGNCFNPSQGPGGTGQH